MVAAEAASGANIASTVDTQELCKVMQINQFIPNEIPWMSLDND